MKKVMIDLPDEVVEDIRHYEMIFDDYKKDIVKAICSGKEFPNQIYTRDEVWAIITQILFEAYEKTFSWYRVDGKRVEGLMFEELKKIIGEKIDILRGDKDVF